MAFMLGAIRSMSTFNLAIWLSNSADISDDESYRVLLDATRHE